MVEDVNNPSRGSFRFRYQKDADFKALIESGIGYDLSDSGYCWAACIDMALSPFVPDTIRLQIVLDAVRHEKLAEDGFNPRGELKSHKLDDFVEVINESLAAQKLPPRLNLIKEQALDDYHIQLQKGRMVIFGMGRGDGGHMMVMERVYTDGGKYIYSVWNPAVSIPTEVNIYFDNFQFYDHQQHSDTKLLPFIISVGEGIE